MRIASPFVGSPAADPSDYRGRPGWVGLAGRAEEGLGILEAVLDTV
jgi:hypothetical protein